MSDDAPDLHEILVRFQQLHGAFRACADGSAAAWKLANDLLRVVNLMEEHRQHQDETIRLLVQRVTTLEHRLAEPAPPERTVETRH